MNENSRSANDSAAEQVARSGDIAPAGAGELTQVAFEGELAIRRRLIAVAVGTAYCVAMIAALVAAKTGSPAAMWVLLPSLVLTIVALTLYRRRRTQRRARETAAQVAQRGLVSTIEEVVSIARGQPFQGAATEMLKTLVACGLTGQTVRIGRPPTTFLRPLHMQFEPQPLNEAFSTLIQAATAAQSATPAARSRARSSPSTTARWFRRNIVMSGGWLIIGVFAFNWLMQWPDVIARRRITFPLILWTVLLLMMLLWPHAARDLNRQWFLVPGGLVLRRSSWRQSHWTLHLFQRRTSVLLVGRMQRQRWGLIVADAETAATAAITEAEADTLLRAWLSPVPPPPIERLSDLA